MLFPRFCIISVFAAISIQIPITQVKVFDQLWLWIQITIKTCEMSLVRTSQIMIRVMGVKWSMKNVVCAQD